MSDGSALGNAPKGVWLEHLTWPDVRAWLLGDVVVVVPVGAIAKEHGHHLPMNTDYVTARELANRVAARLPVLVAPVVSFGYYPAFARYPGSQHLRAETFIALLKDLLGGLITQGAKHVVIINTGVSTEPPIRIAVRDIFEATRVRPAVADIRALGKRAEGQLRQRHGGHGDEAETSTMLAIDPSAVRMDLAKPDYGSLDDVPTTVFHQPVVFRPGPTHPLDESATGVRGDPTLATAELGEALLQAMTDDLVDGITKLFPHAGCGPHPEPNFGP